MDNIATTQNTESVGVLTNIGAFVAQVYGWMTIGMFTTAMVAVPFAFYEPLQDWLARNFWIIYVAFFAQLIMVFAISGMINRLNPIMASGLFLLYSALMGVTLSGIFWAYELGSIFAAFAVTAGTFLLMSAVGYFTKTDLTRIGNLAIMGLIGIIIATVVNIFLQSSGLDLFLTYAGILVFLILIAYDTQKIKKYAAVAEQTGKMSQYAIIAALSLYLDFINLFLRILSLFGSRK